MGQYFLRLANHHKGREPLKVVCRVVCQFWHSIANATHTSAKAMNLKLLSVTLRVAFV